MALAAATTPPVIGVTLREDTKAIAIEDLSVRLPHGALLVEADGVEVEPGEHVLVTGPSGAGKSTLFRAIAGRWPFGAGSIMIPAGAKVMTLPQRPYFPIGTLAAAISYPAEPGAFGTEQLADLLVAVGLPALADRLGEEAHWNRMLSLGEQQRLGIARAILQAPDFLLLDEATASLDEPSEAALYRLLQERLPRAAIISIGHRSTLNAFHGRGLTLDRTDAGFQVREAKLAPAAE
jgi:putative ATP-binding cassette transporter